MEPKLPAPNRGHEQAPAHYSQGFEQAPPQFTPEAQREQGKEQLEQRAESRQPIATPTLPPPTVAPAPPQPIADSTQSAQQATTDDLPLVANDDDLIEKEWVDKAKKIIVETKDDPYRREQEVSRLQADYLRKRYGRELGNTEHAI